MIPAADWKPQGVDDLEPAAWEALRHPGPVSVVAGPGAGKTEFLAQKAAYLLQTGLCPPSKHILALCFKREAAANLSERVAKRCTPNEARRFTSMTFDGFAKSLVDRFLPAVPAPWRPNGYEVSFPKRRDYEDFLVRARLAAPTNCQPEIAGFGPQTFEPREVGGTRLTDSLQAPTNGREFAVLRWWRENGGAADGSRLTFIMLNRLAELLLRTRPQILRAFRATYPFIFLDEFQDTTYAQYDFMLTAVHGTNASLTAVGDDKQRIMAWAGALPDAFKRFEADFKAKRVELLFNHRSSPGLVRIQHIVARAIDPAAAKPESKAAGKIDGDVAQIWTFPNERSEGAHIANWIAHDMAERGLTPRDYAILVKQTADKFEEQLAPAFAAAGPHLRNESRMVGRSSLQDLLSEDLTRMVMAILRLAVQGKAPVQWTYVSGAITSLRAADRDDAALQDLFQRELKKAIEKVKAFLAREKPSEKAAQAVTKFLFKFLDLGAIARMFPQYGQGDDLDIAVEAIPLYLAECAGKSATWQQTVDEFEGVDQVPLMTVHKSKGLEYDTVVFVGLDDKTWWAHKPGDYEGAATFFVALSRAKQRVLFTYCKSRGGRDGVSDLYKLLAAGGVKEIDLDSEGEQSSLLV